MVADCNKIVLQINWIWVCVECLLYVERIEMLIANAAMYIIKSIESIQYNYYLNWKKTQWTVLRRTIASFIFRFRF